VELRRQTGDRAPNALEDSKRLADLGDRLLRRLGVDQPISAVSVFPLSLSTGARASVYI